MCLPWALHSAFTSVMAVGASHFASYRSRSWAQIVVLGPSTLTLLLFGNRGKANLTL